MSNTAEVTPYLDADTSTSSYDGTSSSQSAPGILSRSAADRAADAQFAERKRAERLSYAAVTVIGNDLASLVRAATELGYRRVDSSTGDPSLRPGPVPSVDLSPVCLINAAGSRLSMCVDGPSVTLEGIGSKAVVQQRTLSAAFRHLNQMSGGKMTHHRLPDGSVQLKASELHCRQGEGSASVEVVVDVAGNVKVDIENVRGPRCERVLDDIAKAVSGKVRSKRLKPAYYQGKPGESTRARTRA
jgi:hypothetical protein